MSSRLRVHGSTWLVLVSWMRYLPRADPEVELCRLKQPPPRYQVHRARLRRVAPVRNGVGEAAFSRGKSNINGDW